MSSNTTTFTDPKLPYQWFFDASTRSDLSIDVASVWQDYTGEGVSVGIVDSQIDFNHDDLNRAYDETRDYNFSLESGDLSFGKGDIADNHGTLVAGVIGAEPGNGVGTVGYAYDADLVGFGISYSDPDVVDQVVRALNAAKDVDVVNNSWSFVTNFSDNFSTAADAPYAEAMEGLASEGRDGLGTVAVFSAGNAGTDGSSNYHNFQNSPFSISVGAIDRDGSAWTGTSLGANVLVSAAGRSVQTTNLNDGYAAATGTSFAAPAVSAVVALMLEANPNLGYRDVQQILALSAERDGLDDAPQGDGWRTNGADTYNGGGLHYSDAFGFGVVNAHNAVRLAETWTRQSTLDNRAEISITEDFNAELIAGEIDVVDLPFVVDADMSVEHVGLSLDLAGWPATGNLDVYLISPEGTSVRLLYEHENRNNNGVIDDFMFTSVGTMGEMAAGTWTLQVVNRNPETTNAAGEPLSGRIADATITIYGRDERPQDDVYVYTDEFGVIYGADDLAARSTLQDNDGGHDTINAAAVTSNTLIDLTNGEAQIAGVTVAIEAPNRFEDVYTGDGDDVVMGNARNNSINTGRGDDTLFYSAGDDHLNGGQGNDTLVVDALFEAVTGYITDAGNFLLGFVDLGMSTVFSIETFQFTDVTYSFSDLTAIYETGEVPPADDGTDAPAEGDPADPVNPPADDGDPAAPPTVPDAPGDEYTDAFDGSENSEVYNGSAGADLILGEGGDDVLRGRDDDDWIEGGDGNDRIEGDGGADVLIGGLGADTLRGGDDDDRIEGGQDNDRLVGDAGADQLAGGEGRDRLEGGEGNDTLGGGAGRDVLTGGAGADLFVFDFADFDETDVITDFDSSEGDQILLTGLDDGSEFNVEILERDNGSVIQLLADDGTSLQIRLAHTDVDLQPVAPLDDGTLLIA